MKRRGFLKTTTLLPFLFSRHASAEVSPLLGARSGGFFDKIQARHREAVLNHPLFKRNQAAIIQGMTTETSAQFIVLRSKSQTWQYSAHSENSEELGVSSVSVKSRDFSDWVVDHFSVSGLVTGLNYKLKIQDSSGASIDERVFSALDRSGFNARFAVVSCMKDIYHQSQVAMWSSLIAEAPQFILYAGDTCYADQGNGNTEADLWEKFVETRRLLLIFRADRLIPSLSVWDDHDYGANNANGSYSEKIKSLKTFNAFFGSDPAAGFEHGPGVAKVFEGYGQRFFMMDSRYFRAPRFSGGSLWGKEQESWLLQKMVNDPKPTWIINGTQFFGGYRLKDSYEFGHNANFNEILKRIAATRVPVVLVSGDVHFSEIMEIEKNVFGFPTFEITSSSMHSTTSPVKDKFLINPRRIVSTWRHNFVMIESQAHASGFNLDVRSVSAKRLINFQRKLAVNVR